LICCTLVAVLPVVAVDCCLIVTRTLLRLFYLFPRLLRLHVYVTLLLLCVVTFTVVVRCCCYLPTTFYPLVCTRLLLFTFTFPVVGWLRSLRFWFALFTFCSFTFVTLRCLFTVVVCDFTFVYVFVVGGCCVVVTLLPVVYDCYVTFVTLPVAPFVCCYVVAGLRCCCYVFTFYVYVCILRCWFRLVIVAVVVVVYVVALRCCYVVIVVAGCCCLRWLLRCPFPPARFTFVVVTR